MTDDDKALVQRLRYDCHLAQQLGDEARVVLPATDVRTMADRIEAQAEDNERLRELLNAWTELAREYLDTELAGRTFAALRDANHG